MERHNSEDSIYCKDRNRCPRNYIVSCSWGASLGVVAGLMGLRGGAKFCILVSAPTELSSAGYAAKPHICKIS